MFIFEGETSRVWWAKRPCSKSWAERNVKGETSKWGNETLAKRPYYDPRLYNDLNRKLFISKFDRT